MEEENKIKEFMHFIIQDICDKIGPRPPCSNSEAKCADYIENEMKKYTDETKIEKFFCHPGAYRATFRIPMINLIFSTVFYWFYYFDPNPLCLIISLSFVLVSVIIIQTNLLRNIELIDPLFKEEESTNVFGKFKPKNIRKRIVLLGAHHDSNWEFKILKKSPLLFGIFMSFPVIFNHLMLGIFILDLIFYFFLSNPYFFLPEVDLVLLIFLSIISPFLIYTAINIVSQTPVMGADDNLTGIAVIMAIAQNLKADELINTEIWLVSHGCEEIGDRGSKRFSKKYYNELKDALVVNIDMIGCKNGLLKFDTSEVMFIVKLNKELATELSKIAKKLNIQYQIGHVEAFTDSMAYSQNKIKACSILNMPKKGFHRHYHTTNDTIEKIDFQNLWNCYRILIEFLKRIDENKILL